MSLRRPAATHCLPQRPSPSTPRCPPTCRRHQRIQEAPPPPVALPISLLPPIPAAPSLAAAARASTEFRCHSLPSTAALSLDPSRPPRSTIPPVHPRRRAAARCLEQQPLPSTPGHAPTRRRRPRLHGAPPPFVRCQQHRPPSTPHRPPFRCRRPRLHCALPRPVSFTSGLILTPPAAQPLATAARRRPPRRRPPLPHLTATHCLHLASPPPAITVVMHPAGARLVMALPPRGERCGINSEAGAAPTDKKDPRALAVPRHRFQNLNDGVQKATAGAGTVARSPNTQGSQASTSPPITPRSSHRHEHAHLPPSRCRPPPAAMLPAAVVTVPSKPPKGAKEKRSSCPLPRAIRPRPA